MPYRVAELARQCIDCREVALGECRRCGEALCEKHDRGETERCLSCESAYIGKSQQFKNKFSMFALAVSVVSLVIIAAAAPTFGRSVSYPAILNWLLVAPFGAWGLRALAPKVTRRLFLAERVKPAALEAPPELKLLPERVASASDDESSP